MKKPRAVVVCGLGYGDEGKGAITDGLVRRMGAGMVIRYNGGSQAGHNVVTADGRWHCFAQFGAGTLTASTKTLLSNQMLVDLESLAAEAQILKQKGVSDPYGRLTADTGCILITPMQKFVGRMREIARGMFAYGSCGMGVGETRRDAEAGYALTLADVLNPAAGSTKLRRLAECKLAEAESLAQLAPSEEMNATFNMMRVRSDPETLRHVYSFVAERFRITSSTTDALRSMIKKPFVFEGAQGALLDRTRGFIPYVTQSDTTCRHALDLCASAFASYRPIVIGVLRAYGHRHGIGPFVTEDESARARFDDHLNQRNRWQGGFRIGWLDIPAIRYGIRINGAVDALAVTGLDRLSGLDRIRICTAYDDGEDALADIPNEQGRARTTRLMRCQPRDWIELDGWQDDIGGVRRFENLPTNARLFIGRIRGLLDKKIMLVSVGPTADHQFFVE